MRELEPGEKVIDVVREAPNGLSKRTWTVHEDGSALCHMMSVRADPSEGWICRELTLVDSIIDRWIAPPQDVLDEAARRLCKPSPVETTTGPTVPAPTYAERMTCFLAGHWTKERPTEEGVYPMRDHTGHEIGPNGWVMYFLDPADGTVKHVPGRSMSTERWSAPWPGMPGEERK